LTKTKHPFRSAAAALLVSLSLAACVGIPSNGSVMTGDIVTEEEDFPFAPLPSGPQEDSTQQEILTDFMQAATSPEGSYEIARQFLTADASDDWSPNASVLIREGSGTMVSTSESTVEYGVSTRASIDSYGLYSEERNQGTRNLSFSFESVDGQWRISELEDGTVLSRDNFEAAFDAHALYFFDPSYRYLVPDVRWFPTRSNVSTRIVNALLSGQASWLQQGATLTAFPQGTQLAGPVDVSSGRTSIDFTDEIAQSGPLDKARMQQQLETSLGTVNVNTVSMSVRGVPLVVPDPGDSTATLTPPVDSEPLVVLDGEFGFAADDGIATLPGLSEKIVALNPTAVSLSRGQSSAAVLGSDGVNLVTAGEANPRLLDERANLIAPTIDTWRYVWTVPQNNASAIRAIGPEGDTHEITSSVPSDASIVSMDVSRDGARMLMYVNTTAGPRLYVAAVLRRDGVPAGLGELVDLPVATDPPLDASWVDDRSVATLARSDNQSVVTLFEIGGPRSTLGTADGGSVIAGGNGVVQIRVLTADGAILQRRASGWQSTGVAAEVLATQQ
jgi:hypothetical protein